MKKFLFAALALAGFAACSSESELNETIAPAPQKTLTIFATQQDFDDTRVSIGADDQMHPTVLTWNEGDQIKLVTGSGISATLNAEDVDGKKATFRTANPVGYVENDTYFACYPASHMISTSQLLYSVPATQSGLAKDAVVLYGMGDADAETEGVQMSFKPVNSVLFIHVENAPANGFKSLVIRDYDSKTILSGQVTYANGEINRDLVTGADITINGTEANNYLKSVYVSLPAGVTFETGYILTYTSQDGQVTSYGFNAGTLNMGTIYEAQVNYSAPTVTLGAKTTYSYASTAPATANSMGGGAANGSGTTIFFDENYKSNFAGVQNAMIEDCGFIVDGTYYRASESKVTPEGKEFWMANLTGQSKADHTVQAFIKIKHNETIITSAPQTLSVTGIPYKADFDANRNQMLGWTANDGAGWRNTGTADKLCFYEGYIVSPKFYIPANINISVDMNVQNYSAIAWEKDSTFTVASTSATNVKGTNNSASKSASLNMNTTVNKTALNDFNSALTVNEPYLCISGTNNRDRCFIYDVTIEYR